MNHDFRLTVPDPVTCYKCGWSGSAGTGQCPDCEERLPREMRCAKCGARQNEGVAVCVGRKA